MAEDKRRYSFGTESRKNLLEAHTDLQRLCNEAIKVYDFSVIDAYRGKDEQNKYFHKGTSQLTYPSSKHNCRPSLAVDIVPFPIDWEDRERFHFLAGIFMAIADQLNIKVRWGGDWDQDNDFSDQKRDDLAHFELMGNQV